MLGTLYSFNNFLVVINELSSVSTDEYSVAFRELCVCTQTGMLLSCEYCQTEGTVVAPAYHPEISFVQKVRF